MGKPKYVGHLNIEESDLSTAQVCKDYSCKSLSLFLVLRKNYIDNHPCPYSLLVK